MTAKKHKTRIHLRKTERLILIFRNLGQPIYLSFEAAEKSSGVGAASI